jgi:guanylate kinase
MAVTTIQLAPSTREQLKAVGRKGETYDQIVRRLLAAAEYMQFMDEQYRILHEDQHWVPLRDRA